MKINSVSHASTAGTSANVRGESEHPLLRKVAAELGIDLAALQNDASRLIERIALTSRVIIVEGISGSGKDAFQRYVQERLKGRDVYDYSEGEVLHSWKQLQIEGSAKLRVKFMKLFVNYMRDVLSQHENAIFVLNRFHLSAYVLTVAQEPKLEMEYAEIIKVLRTLPAHVFILQLDKNEIEQRSFHPERSSAWRNFQDEIVKREGFRARLERYVWQQRVILEKAKTQQIPYSIIKVACEPEIKTGQIRISKVPTIVRRGARTNIANATHSGSSNPSVTATLHKA